MNNSNSSAEQLLKLLMNTKGSVPDSTLAQDILQNRITPEQRNRVESILRDKTALENLLSSPQAQELMRKLGGQK